MPLAAFRNTFSGSPLDRAAQHRSDRDWLARHLERPETAINVLWNGAVLVDGASPALVRLDAGLAGRLGEDGQRLLFLGLDPDGSAVFALDLDGPTDPAAGPLAGLGRFEGLRELALVLPPEAAAIAATARALFEWSRRTRFCAACGAPLTVKDGGWRKACPTCDADQFPRTDPVVIMLAVSGERCLLGRQASWAPGRYSALAGFMEPGETIEEACAREIAEEAGLSVTAVRYHSSQPWPFPTNLMIGLFAEVEAGEARPVDGELEAVRWVTREQMRAVLERRDDDWTGGPGAAPPVDPGRSPPDLSLPTPLAIARTLIEAWAYETPSGDPAAT